MPTVKPILFLLRAGFPDAKHGPEGAYCPECATVAGILHYYPDVAAQLDIRQVDVPRPRTDVVALVGEEHQSCPVLVLQPVTQLERGGAHGLVVVERRQRSDVVK